MSHVAPHRSNILVMHRDPLLCAGLVAALREHGTFEVFVDGVDILGAEGPPIQVVIADYDQAMQVADVTVRKPRLSLASARVLVLTSNEREVDIRRAVEAGVHGYLLLGSSLDELTEAVMTVANGVRYLGRSVAQRVADSLTRTPLTSRELDVLRLVVAGESNKAIARQLRIGLGTVKTHMSAIIGKLGVASRTQVVGMAFARGLLEAQVPVQPALPALRARRPEPWAKRAI